MSSETRSAPLLGFAAHAAGVLCVLSGGLLFLFGDVILKNGWLLHEAAAYREASFVVQRVVDIPSNPRYGDPPTYYLEGLVNGSYERYEVSTRGHFVGQALPVLHNPKAPFHDIRVFAAEKDFPSAQRRRTEKWLFAPLTLGLMLWRRQVTGLRPVWLYLKIAALLAAFGFAGSLALRLLLGRD